MVKYILILFSLVTGMARANFYMYGPVISGVATGVSTQFFPQNTLRSYLLIVNTGSNTVYANFSGVQVGPQGIPIPAGGNYEPLHAPSNAVYLTTVTPNVSSVLLMQGQ